MRKYEERFRGGGVQQEAQTVHRNRSFSLGLMLLVMIMAGCAQLPGSSQSRPATPEPTATPSEVIELSRRVTALENWEIRRNLAQDNAAKVGRSAAATQVAPKSLACVRIPMALKRTLDYAEFRHSMEMTYTASCLYEVDRLAETQAANTIKPVPPQPPLTPKKVPPAKKKN